MKKFWWMRGIKFAVFFALAATVGTYVVMSLWNALVPALFSGPSLHFGQALGLLILSRILLGRWDGGHGHRMGWRGRSGKRWQHMTDEERVAFRERFGGRCGSRGAEASEPRA